MSVRTQEKVLNQVKSILVSGRNPKFASEAYVSQFSQRGNNYKDK